ncbi:MAG: Phytoene synthase [Pseudolabrys sp.]|jgi:phytoene synthase|nr:Phytoene synthase [Pseudolabrys sp.]
MDAFAHCRELIAANDKVRFWASLYAPADRRGGLHALYAFDIELASVHARVRDPVAGEIRLQWWREALEGARPGEAAANPVAAALRETVQRYGLSVPLLLALIDARGADLYDEPLADIDAYGAATDGAIVASAAHVLGGAGETVEHIARHAGLARTFAAAGDVAGARGHLDAAAALQPSVPEQILPALLPIAVIRPELGRATHLPPWRQQWLIWRAARNPGRIFK